MTTNHDADQLDRWLESATGGSAKSPNGTTDASPDALVSVARRYHASVHAAEQRAVPTIPARAIWEDVMHSTATINRIVASPIAGENGNQSPPATPPTANSWEPVQPRHWYVPAVLIAIAAIAIVAVYATFFDRLETQPPATGLPGIAFSTPESFSISTPEPDIDRWLPDQSQVACASPEITLSQQSAIAQPSRPTDKPMDVGDYLPFSAASSAEQELIAERALRAQLACPLTKDDPIVTNDFSWMPGPSVALASPAQIETAQQISAALPDQNFLNHYIVRPPSDVVMFDAMGVLLPQDVVMLPDGRMGGPFRIVLETDTPLERIHELTDGRDVATPVFVVFKQVDGLWLYDELFLLCIGDCNDYWAMVSGEMPWTGTPPPSTPAATPSNGEVACELRNNLNVHSPDIVTDYRMVAQANPMLMWDVQPYFENFTACLVGGYGVQHLATSNFGGVFDEAEAVRRDQLQTVWTLPINVNGQTDVFSLPWPMANDGSADATLNVLPNTARTLADGRTGMLVTITPGELSPLPNASWLGAANQNRSGLPSIAFVALVPRIDTISIDQFTTMCVGADCVQTFSSPPVSDSPSATTFRWDDPLVAADCDLPSEFAGYLPLSPATRSYEVTGTPETQAAMAVSKTERVWQSCQMIGDNSKWQSLRVLKVRAGYSSESFEAYREQHPDALLDLLDPNPLHYILPRPADLDPSSQSILLVNPADVMQFADGRLGVPATELLPQWYIDEMTRLDNVPTVSFIFFAPDSTLPHGWVIDEIAILCPEGCTRSDAPTGVVPPATATPAATPDLSQAGVTCDVEPRSLEEISALQQAPPDVPDRQYGPTSPVSPEIAQQVAEANQLLDACRVAGEIRSMASPRLVYETRETGSFGARWAPTTLEEFDDFLAKQQELSAIFSTDNPSDYAVETDQLEGDDFARLILPQNVVQLADGRVGGPVTSFFPTGLYNSAYEYALVEVNIFTQDPSQNNRWVIDESQLLCVGDCDALYELIRSDLAATEPQATPTASPVADEAGLQPITASECSVEGLSQDEVSAIVRDAGDERETSYDPVGPADPEMAQQAAEADRAWQACSWFGSIGQRTVFQTEHLTSRGPEDPDGPTNVSPTDRKEVLLARFDDRRALGEAISTGDWRDYVRASDVVPDSEDWPVIDVITTVPWTDGAVELADGRIAIPEVRLVSPNDWETTHQSLDDMGYAYVPVHILAQDPDSNAWAVDESFSLCVINCDAARKALIEYLDYQIELLGTPAATPSAAPETTPDSTPSANRIAEPVLASLAGLSSSTDDARLE